MCLGDRLLAPQQVKHLAGHAQLTATTLEHKPLQGMDRRQLQHAVDLLKLALNLLNATAEEAMAEALATGALLLARCIGLQLDDASTSGEHLKGFGNSLSWWLIQQTFH